MKTLSVVLGLAVGLAFATGCEKKQRPGFGLEGSLIRYETKKFEDPAILAEVNGQKITVDQILDKSPVIKDLADQERDALIGLAYLKVVEKSGSDIPSGTVEVFLPESEAKLETILQKFDSKPIDGLGIAFKPSDEPNLVAKFKTLTITRDDIDRNNIVLHSIGQRRYQETASQLNGQVSRILVNERATKQGITLQDFIQKEITKGAGAQVSDAELKEHMRKIGFSEQELTPELKDRFMEGLKAQKEQRLIEDYVAQNILKNPIAVAFEAPRANLKLDDDWKPIMGYDDAPVSVVAFSSITCADCPEFIRTLNDTMKKHDGYLRLNWIHNFNSDDGIARMVAEAAMCVNSLKPGGAMAFLNEFAKPASEVDETKFYSWAKGQGLAEDAFRACLVEHKFAKALDEQRAYAKEIGIVANPTLWVDGKTIEGLVSKDQAESLVEDKIEQSGESPLRALIRRVKSWF